MSPSMPPSKSPQNDEELSEEVEKGSPMCAVVNVRVT